MAHHDNLRRFFKEHAKKGLAMVGVDVDGVDVTLHRTGAATITLRLNPSKRQTARALADKEQEQDRRRAHIQQPPRYCHTCDEDVSEHSITFFYVNTRTGEWMHKHPMSGTRYHPMRPDL
jgi:hypothetical protein